MQVSRLLPLLLSFPSGNSQDNTTDPIIIVVQVAEAKAKKSA